MSTKTPQPSKAATPKQPVKTEKKTACRLFAVLFLLVSVAALALLPYKILPAAESMPLYQAIMNLFTAGFYTATEGVLNTVYNVAIYAFAALLALAAILSLVALITGKRVAVCTAAILLTLGALVYTVLFTVTAYVATSLFSLELVSLILAAAALLATIVCFIVTKPKIEEVKEEPVKDPNEGFHVEEYAEAYPYEGGPVAGVLMAEEVNPSFVPQSPRVNTAGYDFYNSKTFDPFIATLDTAERNDFTEIFILKVKGMMPELPDYVVGGDNKEFFRKIFIYLGQYRDKIPSALLGKMYQYSLKIS